MSSDQRGVPAGPITCAYCDGDGDMCNPANLNPHRKIVDWLPPIVCGRCEGTGWDPDGPRPAHGNPGRGPHLRAVASPSGGEVTDLPRLQTDSTGEAS